MTQKILIASAIFLGLNWLSALAGYGFVKFVLPPCGKTLWFLGTTCAGMFVYGAGMALWTTN